MNENPLTARAIAEAVERGAHTAAKNLGPDVIAARQVYKMLSPYGFGLQATYRVMRENRIESWRVGRMLYTFGSRVKEFIDQEIEGKKSIEVDEQAPAEHAAEGCNERAEGDHEGH